MVVCVCHVSVILAGRCNEDYSPGWPEGVKWEILFGKTKTKKGWGHGSSGGALD
jgi:hypothetical protein